MVFHCANSAPFVCLGVGCLISYTRKGLGNRLHKAYTHIYRQTQEAFQLLLINIFCKRIDCCYILPDFKTVLLKLYFWLTSNLWYIIQGQLQKGEQLLRNIYFHTISDIIIIMQIRSDAFGTSGKSHLLTWLEVDSEQQQRIQTIKRLEHDSYSQRGPVERKAQPKLLPSEFHSSVSEVKDCTHPQQRWPTPSRIYCFALRWSLISTG